MHQVLLNKPVVHMNFNDSSLNPKIYQEHHIFHHPHFAPDIKNTITIFHYLWQAFESADKPWLNYYFRSDKQSNIFYGGEFHLICHDTLHCITVALKTASKLKRAFIVIQSHLLFNTVTKHTIRFLIMVWSSSMYKPNPNVIPSIMAKFVCRAHSVQSNWKDWKAH